MEIGAIHGPPGTGKTRTMAGALVECFAREEKILVCGYTNRAVEETLRDFEEAARECVPRQFEAAYKAGRILRKEISLEEGSTVSNPEHIAERLKRNLQHELDAVRKDIRDIQKDLERAKKLKDLLKIRNRLKEELQNEEKNYEDNDNKIIVLDKRIREAKAEIEDINKLGVISRSFKKPKGKFIHQMIYGIQVAQDVKLSNIAHDLNEDISLITKFKM